MKKKIIFLILFGIILDGILVSAIDVSVDNYYPTPVEAGDYFNVWLKITNREENAVENSAIKFKPNYPFSLDPGEKNEVVIEKLELGGSITKKFKIRVDKEAKEGDNDISFEYKDCGGCVWEEMGTPITVTEFQTMFDIVLQELSNEGVYIAIANIGKNTANAITVSIPEQDYFKTDLISASIVGNLDSGDYTIAAFKILPKQKERINENKELFVQIDYTDPFGIRRSVTKKIMLNPSSLGRVSVEGENVQNTQFGSRGMKQGSSFLRNIWFWVALILVIILLRKKIIKIYRKIRGLK